MSRLRSFTTSNRPAPAGTRADVLVVGFDDAHQHVDERSALGGCEDVEDALLRCLRDRPDAVVQRLTFFREFQHTRAAIRAVDGAFEESLLLEPEHQRANVVRSSAIHSASEF